MSDYTFEQIKKVAADLKSDISKHTIRDQASVVLRAPQLRGLYDELKLLQPEQRRQFGQQVNALKNELQQLIDDLPSSEHELAPIDVTAPFDVNTPQSSRPHLLASSHGSGHPLMAEISLVLNIFERMGFEAIESRQIDNEFNMFTALNFPEGHPARDDYDTFITREGLIAPAHTSTMQNRVLKANKSKLADGQTIACVIPGRVFRNEDLDATHEHTFYQLEGLYVDKGVNVGNLIATLKTFLEEYFQEDLQVRTQPFYFPFTEPSFEFAIKRPGRDWMELLGCGLIHPNVLKMADIDTKIYTGFAWGFGIDRLVMMKYGIEDVRHFESGKLEFLRQFK
jgi:phenylalanyl-tRNA synthetase alpha chain